MSDTPRTDAEQGWYLSDGRWSATSKSGTVRIDFARDLERELARALRVVEAARQWASAEVNGAAFSLRHEVNEWEAGR